MAESDGARQRGTRGDARPERCLNRAIVGAALAAVVALAGCASTTATASQPRDSKLASRSMPTPTTTLGVMPPTTVNGLRVNPAFPPAAAVAPPTTWLRVERPDGQVHPVAVYRPAAPGPHPVVVYLHGSSGLAAPELGWAQGLAHRGFIVVVGCYLDVDPAAARPSPSYWIPCVGLPRGEPHDPAAVRPAYEALLDVATSLPDARPGALGVVGVSYGAIAALSTDEPRVRAIVADSGYGKKGTGPVTAPVLLLGMHVDPNVPHYKVQGFEWLLHAAGKTVESHYYPGTGHVATLMYSPMLVTHTMDRIDAWLRRYLG